MMMSILKILQNILKSYLLLWTLIKISMLSLDMLAAMLKEIRVCLILDEAIMSLPSLEMPGMLMMYRYGKKSMAS